MAQVPEAEGSTSTSWASDEKLTAQIQSAERSIAAPEDSASQTNPQFSRNVDV